MSEGSAELVTPTPPEAAGDGPRLVPRGAPVAAPRAEWTGRAWGLGLGFGALLAVTNVYTGLKVGFWESGCVLSALLAFGGLSALGRRGVAPTALETNLAQTTAVSVGALPASAGLLGTVPALVLMGLQPPGWAVAAWGVGLGLLGVLFAFALRRRLLEEEALPFPTGVATAELITSLHTTDTAYATHSRGLWGGSLVSALVVGLRDAVGAIPSVSLLPAALRVGGLGADSLQLGVHWSPMLLGIGSLVGLQTALSLLGGALLGWCGLGPVLVGQGHVAVGDLASWLLLPGVGLMVGASLPSLLPLVRALPSLWGDVRGLGAGGGWESTAGRWVRRGVLPLVLVALAVGASGFAVGPLALFLALVLVFPLCAVCARATGQSDLAPMSVVGQLTQVVFGTWVPGQPGLGVAASGVVAGAASHTSASLWSLQAGRRLGANVSRQFLAQLSGPLVGAAVAIPTFYLLASTHPLGSAALPAPTAQQFKVFAELTSRGFAGLPAGAAPALGVGLLVGVGLSLGVWGRWARVLPSAVALGLGMVLPPFYSVTIALGALVTFAVGRLRPAAAPVARSVGMGAILGESVLGVVIAALAALGLIASG
ncbi:OPT/YSL family transporter [Archangium primigenium]|uniref:OPT/YSL family transporter n=1 Tax=[Archangium] primigenium TaxID=2792470 RepID=UPI0019565341|nr:OPT/YSL family transporter [Archangium primigenium]MBM7119164.1 OPT/YSL family transporter [Archangium primigenium]